MGCGQDGGPDQPDDVSNITFLGYSNTDTGTINLTVCPTDDTTADVLTKGLTNTRHEKHTAEMGLT